MRMSVEKHCFFSKSMVWDLVRRLLLFQYSTSGIMNASKSKGSYWTSIDVRDGSMQLSGAYRVAVRQVKEPIKTCESPEVPDRKLQ